MYSNREPAIQVDGLRKTFGDGDDAVTAVDGISFDVEKGTVIGMLGPNGAGKTTTIKSMLGLVLPDSGSVKISGVDVHQNPGKAYRNIGAILEGARNVYWRLTVQENLSFFAGLGGDNPRSLQERHEALLEQFGLSEEADMPVNELSRGMKQKVSLASTLARDVDVVFMDEPTLGLDIESSLELRSELDRLAEREDVTIILCSHDMDVIETVCDRVLILNDGSIVEYDEVDSLLELFRTREYEVTLESPLPSEVERQLEQTVDANCVDEGDRVTITFTATEGDEVYTVMDIIRETGRELRDISSIDPNLEEVFLRLTETGGENTSESEANGESDTMTKEIDADPDDVATNTVEVNADGNR